MANEAITNLAWRHAYTIVELPQPPETFRMANSPLTNSQLQLFRQNGLIQKANNSTAVPHDWRVTDSVWERAQSYVEETESFDCCGSRGVTNVDGELRCIDCGETITPSEFRRVLE